MLVSLHQVEYALRYCPRTIALTRRRGSSTTAHRARSRPASSRDLYGAETEELFCPTAIHARRSRHDRCHRPLRFEPALARRAERRRRTLAFTSNQEST